MEMDIERLRRDLVSDCYGAFFGAGFGAAMMESFDIERATPNELLDIAKDRGIDLRKYVE